MDVDGDGRLSHADVDALAAIVAAGSPPQDVLDAYDFNNNGVLDSGDVDFLGYMLGCIGSGIFGDADGDGDTDCDDWAIIAAAKNSPDTFNAANANAVNYNIALDYDLDGDLDDDDFFALQAMFEPADFAAPYGVLTFADVQAQLGLFGAMDPRADLAAPYGVFNFADEQAFLGAYGNPNCP